MNNKEEYNRCIIPELCRGEKGWMTKEDDRFKKTRAKQQEMSKLLKETQKELIENAYEPIEDYRIDKVMDEFLFHYSRNKSQEVVDYNRTWDTEIKKVEKHAGPLPERWKAHLYMNKMRVNDMQRSQIMTGALGEFTVKTFSKAALVTFEQGGRCLSFLVG